MNKIPVKVKIFTPAGYRRLRAKEVIKRGDLWVCKRFWEKAALFGHRVNNGIYIRKIS